MNVKKTSLTLAIGAAFAATAGLAPVAHAAQDNASPFGLQKLDSGYQLAAKHMAAPAADKMKDGKCGEGKCGSSKPSSEKMKDGKCGTAGNAAKMKDGKCGGDTKAPEKKAKAKKAKVKKAADMTMDGSGKK